MTPFRGTIGGGGGGGGPAADARHNARLVNQCATRAAMQRRTMAVAALDAASVATAAVDMIGLTVDSRGDAEGAGLVEGRSAGDEDGGPH